jgi:hypothetical protein
MEYKPFMSHKTRKIYLHIFALIFISIFCTAINCKSTTIIIGDSGVAMLTAHKSFPSEICSPYNKSGISSQQLIELISKQSINKLVTKCFVHIGTNDAYQTKNAQKLKSAIIYKYPNCKSLYIIWGTIGWGNVSKKTPCDQKKFYSQYEAVGFTSIVTTGTSYSFEVCNASKSLNYFSNANSAHQIHSQYNQEIINQIKYTLNK